MLGWAGLPDSADGQLWPIERWTVMRCEMTGASAGAARDLRGDIDRVLAAMRRRPQWYTKYVERPLERKQAPVLRALPGGDEA